MRYTQLLIKSIKDADTEMVFRGDACRQWANIYSVARRKLLLIHAAQAVIDLRIPPGNRLEALHGDREGQHSIRINDQYRVCFSWKEDGAHDVEIVDYH